MAKCMCKHYEDRIVYSRFDEVHAKEQARVGWKFVTKNDYRKAMRIFGYEDSVPISESFILRK